MLVLMSLVLCLSHKCEPGLSFLLMLMLMLMFSEDIADISISARSLADSYALTLMLVLMRTCPHWTR